MSTVCPVSGSLYIGAGRTDTGQGFYGRRLVMEESRLYLISELAKLAARCEDREYEVAAEQVEGWLKEVLDELRAAERERRKSV